MVEKSWLMDDKAYKKALRSKKKKNNKESDFYDIPTQIKVQQFLDNNKETKYSNADIANKLNISTTLAAQITSRLSSIGEIKLIGYKKGLHGSTQLFQSSLSKNSNIEIVREHQVPVEKVFNYIRNNKDQIFTKSYLSKRLNMNLYTVGSSLRTLLIQDIIKVVKLSKSEETEYQEISGNCKGIEIKKEIPENYFLLKEFPINDYAIELMTVEEVKRNIKGGVLVIVKHGIFRYYSEKDIIAAIDTTYKNKLDKGAENILSYFTENKKSYLTEEEMCKISNISKNSLNNLLALDKLRNLKVKNGNYYVKSSNFLTKLLMGGK